MSSVSVFCQSVELRLGSLIPHISPAGRSKVGNAFMHFAVDAYTAGWETGYATALADEKGKEEEDYEEEEDYDDE